MFEKTLVEGAKKSLVLLGKSGILKDAYLAGGTALALQSGHRISVDFDFFTARKFVPQDFAQELARLGSFEEEQADRGTVQGTFEGVRLSLFFYDHPHFICRSHYGLVDVLNFYNQKYRRLTSNLIHIQKSLVYFEDAERDEMPRMLKEVEWEQVKKYFVEEVRGLAG